MNQEDILNFATGRPASKWVCGFDRFGIIEIHCDSCGAMLEKSETFWHNYYFCYHCGCYMTNATTIYDETKELTNGNHKNCIREHNT